MNELEKDGWLIIRTDLAPAFLQSVKDSAFSGHAPGQRCLLDLPCVRQVALSLRSELTHSGLLPEDAVAIQAVAFDKTQHTNWRVSWHQDLMFPFAKPVTSTAFKVPSIKDGIPYARPPRDVLEDLLAVRLHIDDCDETNGPLRVIPGSHRDGILKSIEISFLAEKGTAVTCLAKEGEALLMKPLLLHASSQATMPKHRRVLHLVYHTGAPTTEAWHRALK